MEEEWDVWGFRNDARKDEAWQDIPLLGSRFCKKPKRNRESLGRKNGRADGKQAVRTCSRFQASS